MYFKFESDPSGTFIEKNNSETIQQTGTRQENSNTTFLKRRCQYYKKINSTWNFNSTLI